MSVSIGGTTGVTFSDASVQNTAATGFGFKNRIINGAMMIDQRNAGASVTISAGNPIYTLDRWGIQASQSSKVSVQQNAGSVTPPVGFTKYLGVTSLSAYSVGAGDYFNIVQKVEGFNIADLAWGTANAKTITLSAWVYSSLTGTFSGAINADTAPSYPFTYSIPVANTWTQISVTIAGPTIGTWLTTNAVGLTIYFGLGTGSTYSGTAGSWSGNNYVAATGATSVVGTNGATFYITGVQLEKGSTATSFDYRPYGTELALCQRYYRKATAATGAYTAFGAGNQINVTTTASFYAQYPVEMRASPTIAFSNIGITDSGSYASAATIAASEIGTSSARVTVSSPAAGGAAYRSALLIANNNTAAYVEYASEL